MAIQLQIAVIAGVITAAGWLVTHTLQQARDRQKERRESLLRFTERQLEELYGPVAFLVIEGRRTFEDLLDGLGRRYIFAAGQSLPPVELRTWLFWVENDFMPRNQKIKELLAAKTHLIEGPTIPASFLRALDHYNSWAINHLRWQKEQIPYSFHSKINWPPEFGEEVLATFNALKRRHTALIHQLSLPSAGRNESIQR